MIVRFNYRDRSYQFFALYLFIYLFVFFACTSARARSVLALAPRTLLTRNAA